MKTNSCWLLIPVPPAARLAIRVPSMWLKKAPVIHSIRGGWNSAGPVDRLQQLVRDNIGCSQQPSTKQHIQQCYFVKQRWTFMYKNMLQSKMTTMQGYSHWLKDIYSTWVYMSGTQNLKTVSYQRSCHFGWLGATTIYGQPHMPPPWEPRMATDAFDGEYPGLLSILGSLITSE